VSFEAYQSKDRGLAEPLLAEDFALTSPQDDHIDKAAYLQRCFPTADRFVSQEIVELVSAGSESVFLLYEYKPMTGERYRNAKFIRLIDGQLVETQVFFGGRVA
jgi:hypothetical protein